jgi:hypothetical protein
VIGPRAVNGTAPCAVRFSIIAPSITPIEDFTSAGLGFDAYLQEPPLLVEPVR